MRRLVVSDSTVGKKVGLRFDLYEDNRWWGTFDLAMPLSMETAHALRGGWTSPEPVPEEER